MNILIIAAHPDDEVLGCGGTIARLSREGHDIYIGILGEGITSRYSEREQADLTLVETLHARSRQVTQLLGAKDLFMYKLPDNRFDTVPLLDVVKIIEELIDRLKPQVVFTQHGGDLNIDHALIYRATLTATRPVPGTTVKELYAFEVPSSSEWAFQQFEPAFHPNVFIDISDTLESKIKAMEIYDSEMRAFPHPRSREALSAIAQRWGSVSGLKAAEPFQLVRWLR
jgi:LmbE family N-acetylglucosaminyl deacetylase